MCAYGRRYAYEGMHMWLIPLVNDIFSSSVVLPTLSGVHLAKQFLFDLPLSVLRVSFDGKPAITCLVIGVSYKCLLSSACY